MNVRYFAAVIKNQTFPPSGMLLWRSRAAAEDAIIKLNAKSGDDEYVLVETHMNIFAPPDLIVEKP